MHQQRRAICAEPALTDPLNCERRPRAARFACYGARPKIPNTKLVIKELAIEVTSPEVVPATSQLVAWSSIPAAKKGVIRLKRVFIRLVMV